MTLLSSALAAIRSKRPLPVKWAVARLVGRSGVAKATVRVTCPFGAIV